MIKNSIRIFLGIIGILFGIATILSGGRVLFGGPEAFSAAGNVVLFVLWFNFLAGFFYPVAAGGILFQKRWGTYLAILIATGTGVVFLLFGLHIFQGNAYEMRTVYAMTLRFGFWVLASLISYRKE